MSAYEVDSSVGDEVRTALFDTISDLVIRLAPEVQAPRVREAARRVPAMSQDVHSLMRAGGIDLTASLAYLTLLSFFPLVALSSLVFAVFGDPQVIRERTSDILVFYFPASREFLDEAISYFFDACLAAGLIVYLTMVLGDNGLFMAVTRAVNRVFRSRPRRMLDSTLPESALAGVFVVIFLFSVGLTVVFQVALNVSLSLPGVSGPLSHLVAFLTEAVTLILPLLLTGVVFAVVYRALPNRFVPWPDATFGAIVAVVLFEVAKHLFFWVGNITTQQGLLYGPLSSVIILLAWSHVAGLVFLYGASLANESVNLRPSDSRVRTGQRKPTSSA